MRLSSGVSCWRPFAGVDLAYFIGITPVPVFVVTSGIITVSTVIIAINTIIVYIYNASILIM